jgi:uncharacterized protein (UPF0333 family)
MIKPLRKSSIFSRERAQTMVEFALVFPVVLLITYGMIEFGRMMFIYAAVTNAAREGARYGAAAGFVSTNTPYYADCNGIKTAVQRGALLTDVTTTGISYDNGHNPTKTWATCPPIGANRLDPIMLGYRIMRIINLSWVVFSASTGLPLMHKTPAPSWSALK